MFNSWDRNPLLYTAEDGSTSVTPKTHQLRSNFILNANFRGATQSGYCFDWDDASSNYNATGNVLVFGGVKLSGGSNRSVSGNLVVAGKLADPQQAGGNKVPSVNTTAVFDNIAVNPNGNFYSCASPLPLPWWVRHGNWFFNNTFYTPGSPSLPFVTTGCNVSGTTLRAWQSRGPNFDGGSTIASGLTMPQLIALARSKLGIGDSVATPI